MLRRDLENHAPCLGREHFRNKIGCWVSKPPDLGRKSGGLLTQVWRFTGRIRSNRRKYSKTDVFFQILGLVVYWSDPGRLRGGSGKGCGAIGRYLPGEDLGGVQRTLQRTKRRSTKRTYSVDAITTSLTGTGGPEVPVRIYINIYLSIYKYNTLFINLSIYLSI